MRWLRARGTAAGDQAVGQTHGAAAAAKTIFLHVGAPKTGTTFLQHILWTNRARLGEQGVGYPLQRPREHFAATMDLRQMTWGGRRDPAWDGVWNAVAERARAWAGQRVVISNELLGAATPAQIKQAVQSLGDNEIHIVFTARDVARQLPSDWQEQVRHTHSVRYDAFIDDLVGAGPKTPYYDEFWGLHDPLRVLRPWSDVVGTDHVHVITVPPAGAGRDALWRRFAGVVGIDPGSCILDDALPNESLGSVEAELLRRTNARADRVQPRVYDQKLRSYLVRRVLAERPGRTGIPLPERHAEWARQRGEQIIIGLRESGYDIVGDLADLRPQPIPGASARDPDTLTAEELLEAALDALVGLLTRPESPGEKRPPNPRNT